MKTKGKEQREDERRGGGRREGDVKETLLIIQYQVCTGDGG